MFIPYTKTFRFSILCDALLQCQIMRSLSILVCVILVESSLAFLVLLLQQAFGKQWLIRKLPLVVLHCHVVLLQMRVGYVAQLRPTNPAVDECVRLVIFNALLFLVFQPLLLTCLDESNVSCHTLLVFTLFPTIFALFHILSPRSYIIYTKIQ